MSKNATKQWGAGEVVGIILILLVVIVLIVLVSQPTPVRTHKPTGNDRNDKLLDLDTDGQAAMLEEIVRYQWEVTKPFYMGMPSDSFDAFWSFHAKDGRDFVVRVAADPSKDRILNCETLFEAAKVSCFKTFDEGDKKSPLAREP